MCYARNRFNIRYVISRVADALYKDGLCAVVYRLGEILCIISGNEYGVDAKPGKEDLELIVGAAIQVRRRDDVVAGMR